MVSGNVGTIWGVWHRGCVGVFREENMCGD